jgi:hypothetical protein
MAYSLLLTNLGSFCLGVTLAFALLFYLGGRRNRFDGAEGCLGFVLCVSGIGIAFTCYISALRALL